MNDAVSAITFFSPKVTVQNEHLIDQDVIFVLPNCEDHRHTLEDGGDA